MQTAFLTLPRRRPLARWRCSGCAHVADSRLLRVLPPPLASTCPHEEHAFAALSRALFRTRSSAHFLFLTRRDSLSGCPIRLGPRLSMARAPHIRPGPASPPGSVVARRRPPSRPGHQAIPDNNRLTPPANFFTASSSWYWVLCACRFTHIDLQLPSPRPSASMSSPSVKPPLKRPIIIIQSLILPQASEAARGCQKHQKPVSCLHFMQRAPSRGKSLFAARQSQGDPPPLRLRLASHLAESLHAEPGHFNVA